MMAMRNRISRIGNVRDGHRERRGGEGRARGGK